MIKAPILVTREDLEALGLAPLTIRAYERSGGIVIVEKISDRVRV